MRPAGLALAAAVVAASRAAAVRVARVVDRDVPAGECYACEVTCFEDCSLKYRREIIEPDVKDAKFKERAKKKESGRQGLLQGSAQNSTRGDRVPVFAWRTRSEHGESAQQRLTSSMGSYMKCLAEHKCPGHDLGAGIPTSEGRWGSKARQNPRCIRRPRQGRQLALRPAQLLETSACSSGDHSCSRGCGAEALAPGTLSLEQGSAFPVHPVKIGAFSKGAQTLDRCMSSCLAATCGCSDAPGMEEIAKLDAAIKANDAAGDPVKDTPPSYKFRPAFKEECGGIEGGKVSSGLYVASAKGWLEICTEDFFAMMYLSDPKTAGDKCKDISEESHEYGCVWDTKKDACVWGLKPVARCSVRFMSDAK